MNRIRRLLMLIPSWSMLTMLLIISKASASQRN
jgi:hypothetical protein